MLTRQEIKNTMLFLNRCNIVGEESAEMENIKQKLFLMDQRLRNAEMEEWVNRNRKPETKDPKLETEDQKRARENHERAKEKHKSAKE